VVSEKLYKRVGNLIIYKFFIMKKSFLLTMTVMFLGIAGAFITKANGLVRHVALTDITLKDQAHACADVVCGVYSNSLCNDLFQSNCTTRHSGTERRKNP
jgi:hypothetical protein